MEMLLFICCVICMILWQTMALLRFCVFTSDLIELNCCPYCCNLIIVEYGNTVPVSAESKLKFDDQDLSYETSAGMLSLSGLHDYSIINKMLRRGDVVT